jgi:predicted 3-demethylubiquinone-9 3-methyltransferase (glyoxalase superfamily)
MCRTQEEVDHYWNRLSVGGDKQAQQCGWLKDKFGLSWQIDPSFVLGEMLQDKDAGKADRAMKALIQMKKIDMDKLKRAYEGA